MDPRVGTGEQVSEEFRSYTSSTHRDGVFVYRFFQRVDGIYAQKVGREVEIILEEIRMTKGR